LSGAARVAAIALLSGRQSRKRLLHVEPIFLCLRHRLSSYRGHPQQLTSRLVAVYNSGMRIFISHAAQDKELASQLADRLSHAGFAVWNATQEIAPGDNWAKETGRALEESDVMVALITPGALESESLRGDIQYGLTSKKFEHRLLPVLVGFVVFTAGKEVPWILLRMDPVYLESASQGFQEVVNRVHAIAGQETNAPC
jgi:hypothetical protein